MIRRQEKQKRELQRKMQKKGRREKQGKGKEKIQGKLQRKGQITIFLILAVIFLILVLVLISIYQQQLRIKEIVYPSDVEPIANYITSCAETAAKEALFIAGQQGGYTEIPDFIVRDRSSYLALDELNLAPLPYWFYDGKDRIPPLSFIETQISDYTIRETLSCLDSFSAMKDQYSITVLGNMSIETMAADEDVIIRIIYPLRIVYGGVEYTIEEYALTLQVPLKKLYDVAAGIMRYENNAEFFENATISLLSANPNIPMDGLEFSCGEREWHLPSIQREVGLMLKYNLQNVRVANTNYVPFSAPEKDYEALREARAQIVEGLEAGIEYAEDSPAYPENTPNDAFDYFQLFARPDIRPGNTTVHVSYYPEYGMHFTARPNENGVLSTNVMRGSRFLEFLCIQAYHFTYDLIYPIRVQVADSEYAFQFAFPVLINQNEPARYIFKTADFEGYSVDPGFCSDREGPIIEVKATGYEDGFVSPAGIPDVNISYECVRKKCFLGVTEARQGNYVLRTRLPSSCTNPYIIAGKIGYLPNRKQITGEEFVDIPLKKLRTMRVEVVKHAYHEADKQLRGEESLLELDKAAIYLSSPGHEQFATENESIIEIIDDTASYSLDIALTQGDTFVGGYKAENVTLDYDDFAYADTIIFHVFEYRPFPRTEEHKRKMAEYLISGEYKNELAPTFR